MTATTTGALLEAGAVLPRDSHPGQDADTLTARAYTHPALDGRPVVRLVPETLGEAEDLALGFLGLRREADAPPVGQVRRETLGFPAWALVNDPANGHHALALVQDIERLSRLAGTRAGAAKEGFEQLAERLGRSVPHFLPTFYEQAARAFLAHENTAYAASLFGRARAAERVHGLAVDEARQRAVFLEFAFAGALTVKALKEHVRDLTERLAPAAAWDQFRQLTVERCAAGMPPYASLPQDARRLLRAAGLDVAAEERDLLAVLLGFPAVVRAPRSFWTAYRDALTGLVERRPALCARLLEIIPSAMGTQDGGDEIWLGLLSATGADELLTGSAPTAEADPADWLTRWAAHLQSGWSGPRRSPATCALATRMAHRLRAAGRPVTLSRPRGWRRGTDLELLDACLAAGIPVADPPDRLGLDLDAWFAAPAAGRRDLAAVAADPRYGPPLTDSVGETGRHGDTTRLATAATHPVLRRLLSDWLDARAEEYRGAAGLPAARAAVDQLLSIGRFAREVNPDAVARVTGHDLTPLLTRTLRAGLVDELGWPALEEAMRLLDPAARPGPNGLSVDEAWPALIVADSTRAVVVGPDRVLLEHDLRIPDKLRWQRPSFRYADGELLVTWWHEGRYRAYWSARPEDVFDLGGGRPTRSSAFLSWASLDLAGGGRATGARPLRAGDTVLPEEHPVLGDGTGHWRLDHPQGRPVWTEYDPATGAVGRASLPAFLARAAEDEGVRLLPHHCSLLPLPAGLDDSPLGTDGTLLGWSVRAESATGRRLTATTVDGRTATVTGRATDHGRTVVPTPVGALRLPGGAEPVLAAHGGGISLYENGSDIARGALGSAVPRGPGGDFAAGTPLVPPVLFWHALRPRDEAGSRALRALTDETTARLLAALGATLDELDRADAEHRAAGRAPDPARRTRDRAAALSGAVAAALPPVTDDALRLGVAGVVRFTVGLRRAVARLTADSRRPAAGQAGMFEDHRPRHGEDGTLGDAARGLFAGPRTRLFGRASWAALQQIRAVNHVLSGKPAEGRPLPERHRAETLPDGWTTDPLTAPAYSGEWTGTLGTLRALALRATGPGVDDPGREALLLLLTAIAEGPLAGPAELREVTLIEERDSTPQRGGQVFRHGSRTVVILGNRRLRGDGKAEWSALDHDPDGVFGAVAHLTTAKAHPVPARPPAAFLTEVVRLVREKGPAPWRPEAAAAFAEATGSGPGRAALLLAGLPADTSPATLAVLGLRTGQARTAAALLPGEPADVVAALLPDEPAALWGTGPDTAAAARRWRERFGTLRLVPEDVAAELQLTGTAMAALNPDHTPWLSRTTRQRISPQGQLTADDPEAVPDGRLLADAVTALATLGYGLPHGHPLRAALPEGLAALRRRLSDPGLIMDMGLDWTEKHGPSAPRLRAAHGLPEAGGAGPDGLVRAGEAFVLAPWYSGAESTRLRPAGLTGADDPALALIEGIAGPGAARPLDALRAVLGTELERALRAGLDDGSPAGYAQDPARSVPALVAEVAAAHALAEDAAALYLQLLALPDPTDRNRARWTGWRPARAKRAAAELAGSGLVVTAQRPRAGRRLFLPGGWADLKAPALPAETWKAGLYPLRPGARATPLIPVPELFERAWARVRDGDAPAYEELVTRATRKGRR
ncbi:hypothetical protein [Streptomyces litchfieldiae]|uniref:DNA-binding protein n=1 Tax=Streptomyces litchfieldiae TaxID=3075543 RepID=A0ABU2MVD6_9ACTN|nr:hypothetical protein [Streptomyces sp. DSM 44938]MDT0345607.1 hypothetical protein [Streptomyces sp. DSM 44938]